MYHRMLVGDTDQGKMIKERIDDLKKLIAAYRCGEILEKR
jgi:fructose-1,6-bisphosphatase-3